MKTDYVTERLLIRESELPNVNLHVQWLNDPEVVKYSEQRHKTHSHATQIAYLNTFMQPSQFLEIRTIKPRFLIGTMSIHIDEPNNIADVGIMIGAKSLWGSGLGYEAWECVCDDLLSSGIRKIEAGSMRANKAMIQIFEKYKMTIEGKRLEHFLLNGATSDMVLYGKFA